jgi:hypothetical protein
MSDESKTTKRPWWKPSIGVTIFLVLFGLWWGVPSFLKWRADLQVKELCAKDAGVKVYETVMLPPDKFDKWGNVRFLLNQDRKMILNGEYQLIIKNHYYDKVYLSLRRIQSEIRRLSDGKLLGEAVSYSRVGGDPIGPWEASHNRCPDRLGLEKKVFIMGEDDANS